jgi:hypothetical protein
MKPKIGRSDGQCGHGGYPEARRVTYRAQGGFRPGETARRAGLIAPAMRSQMVGRDAAEVPNRSGLETAGAL